MLKAILWDYGGVFTVSPLKAVDDYSREMDITKEELFEFVFGPYHQDTDHPWHQMERGETTLEETVSRLNEIFVEKGIPDFDLKKLFSFITMDPQDRSWVLEEVRSLSKAGIRHGIITNNIKEFSESWRKSMPMELFETVVDSSMEGIRKPSPAIYEMALERMNLQPRETAFVDDMAANVEAANKVGMHGILMPLDDSREAVEKIRELVSQP